VGKSKRGDEELGFHLFSDSFEYRVVPDLLVKEQQEAQERVLVNGAFSSGSRFLRPQLVEEGKRGFGLTLRLWSLPALLHPLMGMLLHN